MLKGLNPNSTIETITDHLKAYGAVEDVRLVRNKTTGESRGFAFVDFATVGDAVTLMSYCPYDVEGPRLEIDGFSVTLSYGREMRNPPPGNFNSSTPAQRAASQKALDAQYFNDWICPQCSGLNFARRVACYQCSTPKPANPETAHDDREGPCSVLVIRGLDYNTTEDTIRNVFSKLAIIKDLRLIKDKLTGQSRGFAFIEFISVEEATKALKRGVGLRIENQPVRIAYSRRDHLFDTPPIPQAVAPAAPVVPRGPPPTNKNAKWIWNPTTGFYYDPVSGKSFDPNSGYYFDTNRYYTYDADKNIYVAVTAGTQTNGAAASSSEPMNASTTTPQNTTPTPTADSLATTATPTNISPTTAVATTAAATTTATATATIAPTATTPSTTVGPFNSSNPFGEPRPAIAGPPVKTKNLISIQIGLPSKPAEDKPAPEIQITPILSVAEVKKAKKEKKAKTSTILSKKMSADVEKWNKKSKELSESADEPVQSTAEQLSTEQKNKIWESIKSANALLANVDKAPSQSSVPSTSTTPSLASSTEITSGNVCLLCKRKFNSQEILQKHVKESELHKTNLEKLKQEQEAKEAIHASQSQEKKNNSHKSKSAIEAAMHSSSHRSDSVHAYENATASSSAPNSGYIPLGEENVGMKMMKKLGWKEGEGLGKFNSGITAPVEAELRTERAGLGSVEESASTNERDRIMPGDSYQLAAKKKARARFFSLMGGSEDEDDTKRRRA
eukprot:TRINITY_DN174_c0_g1_i9.p1 TRINITY_DN174_c0_g1~~TRINITY_DN174_c0_g1_i9.p1  ORF type:complete len:731 (+),score=171.98 TRINITY_DN174_c0_g1_i9:466-2658(+)